MVTQAAFAFGGGRVYSTVIEALGALRAGDFPIDALTRAVRAGAEQRSWLTNYYPRTAKGIVTSQSALADLRQSLAADRWRLCDWGNYARSIHPLDHIAVTVSLGDEATGVASAHPRTSSPKGTATEHAIFYNLMAAAVDPRVFGVSDPTFWSICPELGPQPIKTWILLIFVDEDRGEVRSELSLPIGMDSRRRVSEWGERIMLPSVGYPIDANWPQATRATTHSAIVEVKPR